MKGKIEALFIMCCEYYMKLKKESYEVDSM